MRKKAVLFMLLVSMLVTSACGGSNPVGPGPDPVEPETFSFTFLAARTDRPVAGALVQVDGTDYKTDGSGHVSVRSFKGHVLSIQASGFLQPRKLRLADGEGTEYLWEDDSRLPDDYTRAIAYFGLNDGRLSRPNATHAVVGVDPGMFDNDRVHQAITQAISALNEADQNIHWEFTRGNPSTGSNVVSVRLHVDSNDQGFKDNPNAGALAYSTTNGYTVTGGRVVFKALAPFFGDHLRRAIAHELGHIRGLSHTTEGIMGSPYAVTKFSSKEQEAMRNMFMRPPGNQFPDDSTPEGVQTFGSSGGSVTRLICELE